MLETFFQDYSKVSTIGGVVYIFRNDLKIWKRLFWLFVLILACTVGIYWSVTVLFNWKSDQVLVTVKSVGTLHYLIYFSFQGSIMNWNVLRFVNNRGIVSNNHHLSWGPHQLRYFVKCWRRIQQAAGRPGQKEHLHSKYMQIYLHLEDVWR